MNIKFNKFYINKGVAQVTKEYKITQQQLEQYREEGFIILHHVLTLVEIKVILEHVDAILKGRITPEGVFAGAASMETDDDPGRLIKQVRPTQYNPILDPILRKSGDHPAIISIASQLMDTANAKIFQQQVLIKEPGYPNGTAWHQDDFYWRLQKPAITAWFPLEPLSLENGTMSVFPGSHKQDIIKHVKVGGVSKFKTLDIELDENEAKPLLMPLGSVSFHHKNLIHGAFANFGNVRRVALAQHYTGESD
jgi:ectoine hydroxylase-related dioxygenase (phytanoyl-CoA dioxygenase family)